MPYCSGLSREQVESWGEDDRLPALPSILALTGTRPVDAPGTPSDLHANGIVPVEGS